MKHMTWEEAEAVLTGMFPPDTYTVCMSRYVHIGPNPLSAVTAGIYRDLPGAHIHYATAYDERCNLDEGGWATVVERIREQHKN